MVTNMFQNYCALFIFFFFSTQSLSQVPQAYVPLSDEHPNVDALVNQIEQRLERDLAKISGNYRKEIEEAYRKRAEKVKYSIEEGHYLFDPYINEYLEGILAEIFEANPDIRSKEIRLFLGRSPYPNAYCIGEGSLVLNVGLLRRLENESQVAFVLCHEIAHYSLHHSNKSIRKRTALLNSRKTEQELRKIRRQKFRVGESARSLMKQMVYSTRRHQREYEAEADDLGLKYLKNTRYDAKEATRVLEILDTVDEEKYAHSTNIRTVFNDENYPFKEKWVMEEDLLSFNGKDWDEMEDDSLKTHPDCLQRIRLMSPNLGSYSNPDNKNVQTRPYQELIEICDFEMIEGFLFFEDYGRTIYHALKLLNEYPDNPYLYSVISKCFYLIYYHQMNHDLGGSLDFPDQNQEAEYQELLRFLRKMRLRELAKVNYYFLAKHEDRYMHSEDFHFAWIMANDMMRYPAETNALKELYFENYPDGYYEDFLKEHKASE